MTWHLSFSNLSAYSRLMRMEKPIGMYLLLWPTCWALWIAERGIPNWHLLFVFVVGVVVMRGAGCVINDYADRDFDGHVARTKMRPIPAGEATATEALQLFALLIGVAFLLVLTLDLKTILLSIGGLVLAASYPFMKRYTHFPQIVLGAAFSWSIPMAFMAATGEVPTLAWVLYGANLLWTVGYDTLYAMVDREDDIKIGVKSTAIAFGRFDLFAVAICLFTTLGAFLILAAQYSWHWPVYIAILISGFMFSHQLWSCRHRTREACFAAFLSNHYVGLCLFAGLAIEYAMY